MDRPVLHAFVDELVDEERLAAFAEALPPSRGVHWGSGLEPPPHLVGERARALDVLAQGGLVCASATALAEGMPPAGERPEPIEVAQGQEPGIELLAESFALSGYERVERVEERGQFAVRGGLVDLFPTTGREPLRIELFGEEIESIRAFSPFTQRALHPVERAVVYPAAERRPDLTEPTLPDDELEGPAPVPGDLVPPLDRGPDLVWEADEVRKVSVEELNVEPDLEGSTELDPLPANQPFSFEAQRPALAARGLAEAENELGAFVRAGQRVVVAFPHRGEALRTQNLLRRIEARLLEPGEPLPGEADLVFAVAPARRGFVWRELGLVLLADTQVFRKRPPGADRRLGRALQSFADLRTGDYVVHEDHGVGRLQTFETKEVAGVTRDYLLLAFRGEDRLYVPHEQIGRVSRYVGADGRSPALSKLGGKAWQNLKSRARASLRELAGELLALYARRQQAEGQTFDLRNEWLERLETEFPYRETEDQQRAIEAVKEDLEAPRPMDRLVCGDVGFGKTEVAVRAAFAVAVNGKQTLMLVPTTVLAQQHWNTFRERYRDFPVRVEMISRFRSPADVKRVLADYAEGKVDVLIGTHRVLSRDVIPKQLGLIVVDEAAERLRQLCPELRFIVAHGQMREKELEDHMLSFLAGDGDVLVSTTIIESGLDIPQANTLVVERADALGLAQLYQIRGRVGRSDLTAHAYLFYPDSQELTPEARARLATLADHTELGAGFAIAMRDLEIRGAGDLLGAEQSGHVAALGFELYVELLGEAVAELSGQRRPVARPVRVDARVDAYVPASYIGSEALKIDLHRRLALTESEDDLRELQAGTEDRYGPLPEPVENLFAIQEAKLKLARLGADYLVFRGCRATVGPVELGSGELRTLRGRVETAVYTTARREVSLRDEEFDGALRLVDAMLETRQAA